MTNSVIRFGGNSLKKEDILEAYVKLLKESKQDIVIVVSAIPEIQEIIETSRQSMQQKMQNLDSKEDRKEAIKTHRQEEASQIDEVLTEEQNVKFNELIKKQQFRMRGKRNRW